MHKPPSARAAESHCAKAVPGRSFAPVCASFAQARHALGTISVLSTSAGIVGVHLGPGLAGAQAAQDELAAMCPHVAVMPAKCKSMGHAHVDAVLAWLGSRGVAPLPPLAARGTPFMRRVWQALQHIEWGQTRSYSELAQSLGLRHGARAVALACAKNPLAAVVPCHRVVRSDGTLAGFRWGLALKRALLAWEQQHGPGAQIKIGQGDKLCR